MIKHIFLETYFNQSSRITGAKTIIMNLSFNSEERSSWWPKKWYLEKMDDFTNFTVGSMTLKTEFSENFLAEFSVIRQLRLRRCIAHCSIVFVSMIESFQMIPKLSKLTEKTLLKSCTNYKWELLFNVIVWRITRFDCLFVWN